jgi:hypothetical protein
LLDASRSCLVQAKHQHQTQQPSAAAAAATAVTVSSSSLSDTWQHSNSLKRLDSYIITRSNILNHQLGPDLHTAPEATAGALLLVTTAAQHSTMSQRGYHRGRDKRNAPAQPAQVTPASLLQGMRLSCKQQQ